MKYRYLSDCHVHSDASFDGHDSVVMLCENAVRMGLHALTITDHFECNEYQNEEDLNCIRKSLLDTQRAAIMFEDRLRVYHGIELGQPTQNPAIAQEVLSQFSFDFVLGSLHNIKGQPDFYFLDYTHIDVEALLNQYFREILELIEQGWFDALSHLTYPLRYIRGEQNIEVSYAVYEKHVDAILQALVQKQKALELNSSGLRQKIGTTMPCPMVIKRFRELGGTYVTVGSDAHRWGDIGSGIEEAMTILKRSGFEEFTIFENRHPHLQPIA